MQPLIVCMCVRPVRVHIAVRVQHVPMRGVFDLAVQAQTVPPFCTVGAKVTGERTLARVHTHMLHQLVGGPGQVAAAVTAVLVALAMTLEVNQQLLLPWKQPLADAAAILRDARLQQGCLGNCQRAAGGSRRCDGASGR